MATNNKPPNRSDRPYQHNETGCSYCRHHSLAWRNHTDNNCYWQSERNRSPLVCRPTVAIVCQFCSMVGHTAPNCPETPMWTNCGAPNLHQPRRDRSRSPTPRPGPKSCFHCHQDGHIARYCPNRGGRSTSPAPSQTSTTGSNRSYGWTFGSPAASAVVGNYQEITPKTGPKAGPLTNHDATAFPIQHADRDRTVVAKPVPTDWPLESIKAIFSRYGEITSLCRASAGSRPLKTVFIVYADRTNAEKLLGEQTVSMGDQQVNITKPTPRPMYQTAPLQPISDNSPTVEKKDAAMSPLKKQTHDVWTLTSGRPAKLDAATSPIKKRKRSAPPTPTSDALVAIQALLDDGAMIKNGEEATVEELIDELILQPTAPPGHARSTLLKIANANGSTHPPAGTQMRRTGPTVSRRPWPNDEKV